MNGFDTLLKKIDNELAMCKAQLKVLNEKVKNGDKDADKEYVWYMGRLDAIMDVANMVRTTCF